MLWSGTALRGYSIRATDDTLGRVDDLLFDDAGWTVRYLVVDTSRWLFGRRVLIAVGALGHPDAAAREFPVALTRDRVKNSPDIDADKPVSRQQETALGSYYGWAPYWTMPGAVYAPGVAALPPDLQDAAASARDREEPAGDPHLRSVKEVTGYQVAAADGEIGSVDDFLVDEAGWLIRYAVIDTGRWLPGKHVLLSPHWISSIDWSERRVHVGMTRQQIQDSPEYDPMATLSRDYEERLHGHYGRPPYWT